MLFSYQMNWNFKEMPYDFYTDGSALGNGQQGSRGGYGVHVPSGTVFCAINCSLFEHISDTSKNVSGSYPHGPQTNNRYELEAIKHATQMVIFKHSYQHSIFCIFRLVMFQTATWESTLIPRTRRILSPNGMTTGSRMATKLLRDKMWRIRISSEISTAMFKRSSIVER